MILDGHKRGRHVSAGAWDLHLRRQSWLIDAFSFPPLWDAVREYGYHATNILKSIIIEHCMEYNAVVAYNMWTRLSVI